MKSLVLNSLVALIATAVLPGCGQKDTTTATGSAADADQTYLVVAEPQGAVPVGEARKSAGDDEEIVMEGRIGGSPKPFVEGIAAFTIVDPKVQYCADDEGCPTPWDYCCNQNEVKDNIAMVKVVDEQGQPVAKDARELLGVKELKTVVVKGRTERDEEGNLAILATQIFVK